MDSEKKPEENVVANSGSDVASMHALSRRALLKLGAAAGAGMVLGMSESAMSQTTTVGTTVPISQKVDRVDIHAHFVPAFYREALGEAGLSEPDGIRAMPSGTPTRR